MNKYSIVQWDITHFKTNRISWTELLNESDNDHLFSSWEWQYTWWTNLKNTSKKLNLFAIYSAKELVAIIPLFTHKKNIKGILPIITCQFIGCSYGLKDLNRSDNLDIIIKHGFNNSAIYTQLSFIFSSLIWNEFIIDGASKNSHIWQLSKLNTKNTKIYLRNKIYNYIIKLDNDFVWYKTQLKKRIRQKAILHRRFIEGDNKNFQLTSILAEDHDSFFVELNRLRKVRWNKPVYADNRLKFQQDFIQYCNENKELKTTSTLLYIDGENQSAFYSITTKNQTYFLQFGFDPMYNPKLSLGYIHLGYAIEMNYEAKITQMQLLPGGGQYENYKHYFVNKIQPQLTYSHIRGDLLRCLLAFFITLKKIKSYLIKGKDNILKCLPLCIITLIKLIKKI